MRRPAVEAHAFVLCSMRRGWKDDPNLPLSIADVLLDFAERLPRAGQA